MNKIQSELKSLLKLAIIYIAGQVLNYFGVLFGDWLSVIALVYSVAVIYTMLIKLFNIDVYTIFGGKKPQGNKVKESK